jgi:hypothetical protein
MGSESKQKKRTNITTQSSFTKGVARLIDVSGKLNNNDVVSPKASDAHAIRSDWVAVGRDISHAIREYEKSNKGPETAIKGKGITTPKGSEKAIRRDA